MPTIDRRARLLAAAIAVLLVAGLATAGALAARDAAGHVASVDAHVREQLVTIRATLDAIQSQVRLTREVIERADRQLEISEEALAELRRSIQIQERLLAQSERMLGRFDESLRIQRELLRMTRLIHAEVREINEKTPESGRAAP